MKHNFSGSFALILLAALITFVPGAVQSQSNTATGCAQQQRKELALTILDKNGSVVDNLRAEHLSLKVGNSNATISDVSFHDNDQPLDLVVLIDVSVSQEKVLPLAKAGAQGFINSVATAGRDRVAVVSFSNKSNTNPVLTSDLVAAGIAIDQFQINIPPGYIGGGVVVSTTPPKNPVLVGSTSLWDVIQSTGSGLQKVLSQ